MSKTPPYIAKAIKNYEKKITKRSVVFNKETESDLINAIDNDEKPFSTLIKELLKKHYNL